MCYEGIEYIYNLLDQRRLKEALTQLQGLCTQTNDWQLRNKVEETLTAYTYMLQYAEQGMKDPNRKAFFQKILGKAYELAERADIILLATRQSGTFFDRLRTFAIHPLKSYSEIQLQLEAYTEDMGTAPLLYSGKERLKAETEKIIQAHESALTELFNKTWTTLHWTEDDAKEANGILESVLVSPNDLAVMVSAATLSLIRIMDIRKVNFLLDAYRHENLEVNQRAIVGIAILLANIGNRLSLYPETRARLSLLSEESGFRKNMQTIQTQMILTRETAKIDKKMQEEIIPQMMKNAKKMNDPKFMFDDPEEMERNPEWSEWMDKSGMTDNLRMMSEWQMEGADVYMSSFAQLKHYPFFHEIAHWFYPFDRHQPALAPLNEDFEDQQISPLKLITSSDFFCNSDKYSFCLALLTMPAFMKEKSIQDMQAQVEMSEEKKEKLELMMNKQADAKGVSRKYLQDLYRFFKLWKYAREEKDVFLNCIEFWKIKALDKIVFEDEQFIRDTGDLLMQKEYYVDAISVYHKLIDKDTDIVEIWQKVGFCHQKREEYYDAIWIYERADLLQPDNLWTNQRLAQCHWGTGNKSKALEFYRKVEAVKPDDLKISMRIALCLIYLRKYEEALTYLYKVEYLEKKPDNARRSIAWCLFLMKRYEEALKFYRLLLEGPSPTAQDWMNAGHVYLVTHQFPKAKEYYLKAQSYEKVHSDFVIKFNEDKRVLLGLGMEMEDILIMLDLLV